MGWYRGLKHGKYTPVRIIFLTLNLLLTAAMILMAASAVMMSGNVFVFSPVPATEQGRALHTASTTWGIVLMALHVGLHTHSLWSRLYRKVRDTAFAYAYILLFLLVLAAGIGCCFWSGLCRGDVPILHRPRNCSATSLLWAANRYDNIGQSNGAFSAGRLLQA